MVLKKAIRSSGVSCNIEKEGIILIRFADTTHYTAPYRPYGYTTADFDSMMFSYNYWYETDPQIGRLPHLKMKQYSAASEITGIDARGKLKITGKV